MADEKKVDNSTTNIPSFAKRGRGQKSRLMQALLKKDHLSSSLYVDGHKRVETYREYFKKEGHNILENMKKDKRSKK